MRPGIQAILIGCVSTMGLMALSGCHRSATEDRDLALYRPLASYVCGELGRSNQPPGTMLLCSELPADLQVMLSDGLRSSGRQIVRASPADCESVSAVIRRGVSLKTLHLNSAPNGVSGILALTLVREADTVNARCSFTCGNVGSEGWKLVYVWDGKSWVQVRSTRWIS